MGHPTKPEANPPGSYAFITLGCKSNQYDTSAMAASLRNAGMSPAGADEADVIIVNTCMVTGPTEAQCRQAIRRAKRANSSARIVVAGCLSKGDPDQLMSMDEVDLVLDPTQKGKLPERLGLKANGEWTDWPEDPAVASEERDRGFLKVQDGCDHQCSYCIVPSVRGPARSLEPERIVTAVRSLMKGGRAEVVLTGIHLGLFGRDLSPGTSLEDLIQRLLNENLPGRVRLSSLEPLEISKRLLTLIGESQGRICPHLHIPLQSGSDRILRLMNRPYLSADFELAVRDAVRKVPGIGIGCDVICGFPGETDEDFSRTEEVVAKLKIPFLHVFPYSPRPGTRASRIKDDVPPPVKKARVRRLMELAAFNQSSFLDDQVGTEIEVVTQSRGSETGFPALADNYSRVTVVDVMDVPPGALLRVRIYGKEGNVLMARKSGKL